MFYPIISVKNHFENISVTYYQFSGESANSFFIVRHSNVRLITLTGNQVGPPTDTREKMASKQCKINHFFLPAREQTTHEMCSIIVNTAVKCNHQGENVRQEMEKWKGMYSWLLLSHYENENMRLKCDLCSQYNIKSVWASEGTPNIQNVGN